MSAAGISIKPSREPSHDELGLFAVQLAMSFPFWVRRRRFVISYVEDETIRQRMTVDFTLPDPDWFLTRELPEPGSRIYVPIHIPVKETLDRFTVFDESARRLSMLATAENGALAVAGLFALARERVDNDRQEQLKDAIARIVFAEKAPGKDPVHDVLEPALQSPILTTALPDEDQIKTLLRDLAGGFLMLVPVRYEPGVDRLIKAEWDLPNYWYGHRDMHPRWARAEGVAASFGLVSKWQMIPKLQIGWARSTHVELTAPPDVDMRALSLNVNQYDPEHEDQVVIDGLRTIYRKPQATINISPRVRLAPNATEELMLQCRSDTASVDAIFRPPGWGVLGAATVASVTLSTLLWIVAGNLTTIDRQTFAAVLLVFPAIVAVYLLRPGEHAFARRLLIGVRLSGLIVAGCSLIVAAMLGAARLTVPERTAMPPPEHHLTCERSLFGPVDCTLAPTTTVKVAAYSSTRTTIQVLAAVATFFAIVLLAGWLQGGIARLRDRGKIEERKPFPEPDEQAPVHGLRARLAQLKMNVQRRLRKSRRRT